MAVSASIAATRLQAASTGLVPLLEASRRCISTTWLPGCVFRQAVCSQQKSMLSTDISMKLPPNSLTV